MMVVKSEDASSPPSSSTPVTVTQTRLIKKTKRIERAKVFERLPRTIIPSHYEVFIEPDFSVCETFNGITTCKVQVIDVTRSVHFNSVGLDILEATYEDDETREIMRSIDIFLDEENEVMVVEFEKGIMAGTGIFSILYIGPISDSMKGFFRTPYSTPTGEQRYAFGTFFEPAYARHAFPCLDEPDFKATFDVSMVVPANRIGLSNMPVVSDSEYEHCPGHYRILKFETTPPMSTYLLSFAIGEWETLEGKTQGGTIVRAFTPLGKKEEGEYGLDIAIKSLDFYSNYFHIPYPLPKMDLITFPAFIPGWMENWGLCVFRDSSFLVEVAETSSIVKQWTGGGIAQCMAHQWVGNLVSCSWWSEVWLNASLSSFMRYMVMDSLFPRMEMWRQFLIDVLIPALEMDGLRSSHPVEVEIQNPTTIPGVFDTVTYSKGAALIQMIHSYLGDSLFQSGLSAYLRKYSFSTGKSEDFWMALEENSDSPVLKIMKTWTNQEGFPLIRIAEVAHKPEGRSITITQEKFCSDPKSNGNKIEFGDRTWVIPLSFSRPTCPELHRVLMDGTESCYTDYLIPNVAPYEWVKVNGRMSGFFRVHYPQMMLREFVPSIRRRLMAPSDRLNLLDDFYAIVKSGDAATTSLLRLLESYVMEDDYVVWEGMSRVLGGLKEMLDFTDLCDKFFLWALRILRSQKERLGWDPIPEEGELRRMYRSSLLVRLISLDDEETINEGKRRFFAHLREGENLNPDLKSAIYRAAIATGEEEVFNEVLSLYENAGSEDEKLRILRALGSTKEPHLMSRILTFSLSPSVHPLHILSVLLNLSSSSKEGKERAWDFFKMNFALFKDKFPSGETRSGFVKALLQGFCSNDMATHLEQWFRENPLEGTESSLRQAVEMIRINEAWRLRDLQHLRAFFASANIPESEIVTID